VLLQRRIAETEPYPLAQEHPNLETESLKSKRRGRTLPVTAPSRGFASASLGIEMSG
jgi:hypothetical protein